MNSETPDFFGWIVPVAATLLAIYSAVKSTGDSPLMLSAAVVLLAWVERRRTKIVTAALIRIVDEKGGFGDSSSVAFTFQYSAPENAFGELIECSPSRAKSLFCAEQKIFRTTLIPCGEKARIHP